MVDSWGVEAGYSAKSVLRVSDTRESENALQPADHGANGHVEVLPPKPKRTGRPKGSKNRVTREMREVAQKYTLRATRKLWKLANEGKSEDVQMRACIELLDRAHGKPAQTQLVGGADGATVKAGMAWLASPLHHG